jgi:adenylate cyclase
LPKSGVKRRLSAILAADVVVYSLLMGEDETGTLERLKSVRRELVQPAITDCNGRIVKLMGDGFLAEFPSVVEAVQCAVAIQREIVNREVKISKGRRIVYRIGINLGDIVIDGDDIFGDGVNIAARLEQMADPGGICISGTTFDQLKSKVDVGYEAFGEVQVKNIQQPVRTYRVLIDPDKVGEVIQKKQTYLASSYRLAAVTAMFLTVIIGGGALWWSLQRDIGAMDLTKMADNAASRTESRLPKIKLAFPEKPSIAVLPFDNLSNAPQQEYFSDGITEDLITDLSQVSGLFVIARNTVFTYKGKAQDIQQVGNKLGVKYILEGSVRKAGDNIRINAQLIDVQNGGHIWAQRYDRKLADVFALQDEVVQKIVAALAITLKPIEKKLLDRKKKVHPDAYVSLLRGLERLRRFSKDTNIEAREYFERAITLDPKFSRAHADLALTHALDVVQDWTDDPKKSSEKALNIAQNALDLDNRVPQTYFALSLTYRRMKRLDDATAAIRRAIALDPNYADGYADHAINLNYSGQPEKGLTAIEHAIRLNPEKPFFYVWAMGQSYYLLGRYEEARELFEEVMISNSQFPLVHKMLVVTYSELGQFEDAEWAAEELLTLLPNFTLTQEMESIPYKDSTVLHRYIEGFRKAGLN